MGVGAGLLIACQENGEILPPDQVETIIKYFKQTKNSAFAEGCPARTRPRDNRNMCWGEHKNVELCEIAFPWGLVLRAYLSSSCFCFFYHSANRTRSSEKSPKF